MTLTNLMDHLADFLNPILLEYGTEENGVITPLKCYAGYPPQEKDPTSFVYVLVTDVDDIEDNCTSLAKVQIGVSIYDPDKKSNGRALFNLCEHIRQHLLKNRTVNGEHRLTLPLKFNALERAWPQWQGVFTASYTIGQPCEEVDFYDEPETITTY